MGARCATAPIRANVVLAADGSFSRSGTAKVRSGRRVVRTPYTISGTINGLTATGTASAKSTDREPGYVTETCKTGTVAWGARRSFGDIGVPGAAPPGVHLYGVTKQAVGKRRHAIALRISPDGTRVKRALYSLNLKCGSGTDQIVDSPKQNLTIRADGKVSNTESYSRVVDRHRRVHLKESFSAKVGSTGATGSFKVAGRVSSRRTGRTLLLCSSGKVKWTAGV
jgi:hypothetical protein